MNLLNRNRLGGNLIFGPSVVIVPGFHVVGKLHKMLLNESYYKAPEAGVSFWRNEKPLITNIVEPSVYYGLTRLTAPGQNTQNYLPSVKVADLSAIPDGFSGDSIPTSVCVRFQYVGRHHFFDINQNRAKQMYEAIGQYLGDKNYRRARTDLELCWERIDETTYDGEFCYMKWFAPIHDTENTEKTIGGQQIAGLVDSIEISPEVAAASDPCRMNSLLKLLK